VTATIGGIVYEVLTRLGVDVVRKTVNLYRTGTDDEEAEAEEEEKEETDDAMYVAYFNQ